MVSFYKTISHIDSEVFFGLLLAIILVNVFIVRISPTKYYQI